MSILCTLIFVQACLICNAPVILNQLSNSNGILLTKFSKWTISYNSVGDRGLNNHVCTARVYRILDYRGGHPFRLALHMASRCPTYISTEIFFQSRCTTYFALHILLKYCIFDPLPYILYVAICRARPPLVLTQTVFVILMLSKSSTFSIKWLHKNNI